MAQHGKGMIVGACRSVAYHSVKEVLLANSGRYEVDSDTVFFLSGKPTEA
jgi:hypothetical protein